MMNEKPIKEAISSTGGRIAYFHWGLRHTEGVRYSAKMAEAQNQQSSSKTDPEE